MVVTLGLNVRISRLLRHLIDIGSLVSDQLRDNYLIEEDLFIVVVCELFDTIHQLLDFGSHRSVVEFFLQ